MPDTTESVANPVSEEGAPLPNSLDGSNRPADCGLGDAEPAIGANTAHTQSDATAYTRGTYYNCTPAYSYKHTQTHTNTQRARPEPRQSTVRFIHRACAQLEVVYCLQYFA